MELKREGWSLAMISWNLACSMYGKLFDHYIPVGVNMKHL